MDWVFAAGLFIGWLFLGLLKSLFEHTCQHCGAERQWLICRICLGNP